LNKILLCGYYLIAKWFDLNNIGKFTGKDFFNKNVDIKFSATASFWYNVHQKAENPNNLDLWKERLKSDGQQFHQHQQNEQPPPTLTHWTQKIPYDVEYLVSSLEHAEQCGGVKLANVIQIVPSSVLNVWGLIIPI